jgi:hypothetical protein
MAVTIMTPKFRVSYPNVFKPKRNELNGKDEYSLVALFPKGADLSALEKAIDQAINEKWPDPKKRPKNLRTPIRDQGDRDKGDGLPSGYEEGAKYLNLKTSERPGLVDQRVQPIIEPSDFYPGCWARATVSVYAYDQAGNRGVGVGLQNVQKVADGDPLGGRVKAENAFKPIDDDSAVEDFINQ